MNIVANFEYGASSSRGKHEGESSFALCDGSAGLAITVRGSSRRIMIMRFRPANIRLINRRSICPGCCSLCPREKGKGNYKNIPTDFAELTRSLHIRPMYSLKLDIGCFFWVCGPRLGNNPADRRSELGAVVLAKREFKQLQAPSELSLN
jgi:hypothetical protein